MIKVYKFTLDLQLVKDYESFEQAGRHNEVDPTQINAVVKGKKQTCGGFFWMNESQYQQFRCMDGEVTYYKDLLFFENTRETKKTLNLYEMVEVQTELNNHLLNKMELQPYDVRIANTHEIDTEIGEMYKELGINRWWEKKQVDILKFKIEYIDVLCWALNIAINNGFTAQEINVIYNDSRAKKRLRRNEFVYQEKIKNKVKSLRWFYMQQLPMTTEAKRVTSIIIDLLDITFSIGKFYDINKDEMLKIHRDKVKYNFKRFG